MVLCYGALVARRLCLWWTGFAASLLAALCIAFFVAGGPVNAQAGDEAQSPDQPTIVFVVSNVDNGVVGAPERGGLLAMVAGPNRAEQQLGAVLAEHGDVRVIADELLQAKDVIGADLVVITAATDSSVFRPFLFKTTVPVIALKPANWNALGLAKRNADTSTPLQTANSVRVDRGHAIAAGLALPAAVDEIELFMGGAFPIGRGWVAGSEPTGDAVGDVVAAGVEGAALLAYEPGDALGWPYIDASDTAIACRVAFPSHGAAWAMLSTDGIALFSGAVDWTLGDTCAPDFAPRSPALHGSMCLTEAANEDEIARGDALIPRGVLDEPNLSSLWVRATEYAELDGDRVVFFGGRFQTVYDADAVRDEDGALLGGVDRQGVFGCELGTGTVTALDVPIAISPLTPTGDTVLNERVRALAYDGTWLYIGGKFSIDLDALDAETRAALPEVMRTPTVSLIRVDPGTGMIDLTWRPNLRGSVSALAIHDDQLYVGGGVRLADDQPVTRLVRISIAEGAGGRSDATFTPTIEATVPVAGSDPFAAVLALEVANNTLYAGGSFQFVDGLPRNSIAAFDLATGTLTEFAPSIGDNNLGTDPIAQIKDIATMNDGSILACGDWWVIAPTPGRTWTAYDHDGGDTDPNGDDWHGQRSKIQPRPNQFNLGKFDALTGAAAMVDGTPWGPVTDGGIQACDVDPVSGMVILGGHYESIGAYEPTFVPEDTNSYPDSHVSYEKLTAVDGETGEILRWDTDIDSIRGLDAVAVIPGALPGGSELVVGGAMTVADRQASEGVARYIIG